MLNSVEAVIDNLGGTTAAAGIAGVGPSAVSNWKTRGKFPSEMFLLFSEAVARNGSTVDPALFSFREPVAESAEART